MSNSTHATGHLLWARTTGCWAQGVSSPAEPQAGQGSPVCLRMGITDVLSLSPVPPTSKSAPPGGGAWPGRNTVFCFAFNVLECF